MKLSALEIKQQKFAKTFRGYDEAEVHSFLNVISNEWDHLTRAYREKERELERLSDKLEHYEKVEQTLHETLQTARESSDQRMKNAREEAKNLIKKADLEAEKVMNQARQDRLAIRQSIQRLLEKRTEMIRGMESYLGLSTESLQAFKEDASLTFTLHEEEDAGFAVENRNDPENSDHFEEADQKASKKTQPPKESPDTPSTSDTEDLDELLDDIDE